MFRSRTLAARAVLAALAVTMAPVATIAETADYGQIELTGLARDIEWPYNAPGESNAMVCNVNGPDGFLSIRTGPGTEYPVARSLKRLATMLVDTGQRRGNWIKVLGAHRAFSTEGKTTEYADLPVTGWAHDGFLCSFLDYEEEASPALAPTSSPAQTSSKMAACEWSNGTGASTERYACEFLPFDGNGSFSAIRDDGYELMLEIESTGVATVTEYIDGRQLGRLGRFRRSTTDPACWDAKMGMARLCAR